MKKLKWGHGKNVKEYLDDNRISVDSVHGMFEAFKNSDEFHLILAHLLDYKDKTMENMKKLDMSNPGYGQVMAGLASRLSTVDWFKAFIEELKGFEQSELSDGPDLKRYI